VQWAPVRNGGFSPANPERHYQEAISDARARSPAYNLE
jgi:hypothetical protein